MWTFPETRTLGDTPRYHRRHNPSRAALAFEGASVTFLELDNRSSQIANALLALGLVGGARIGYLGRNTPDLAYLLYGAAKAGFAFMPLNWRLAPREIAALVDDSKCSILFVDEDLTALADSAAAMMRHVPPTMVFIGGALPICGGFAETADTTDPQIRIAPDATALVVYTSGTTGVPKGVQHSHEAFNYIRLIEHLEPEIEWGLGDVFLMAMPNFHLAGIGWVIQSLYTGMCVSMLRMFEPGAVIAAIRDTRPNIVMMVPTMLMMVLNDPEAADVDFSCIDLIAYAGSAMPLPLIKRALAVTGCKFLNCYGTTEVLSTAIWLRPSQHNLGDENRLRSIGTPAMLTEVRLLDESGREVATGEVGEIVIRMPSVFQGYLDRPEHTAEVLQDGWYWTGDGAYRDEQGFFFLKDRLKDMIVSGGENIYPSEIEHVLHQHEEVAEATVVGLPDEVWGESVTAIVVAKVGRAPDAPSLAAFCREHIAGYKVPKRFVFAEDLPRTPSGKVQKQLVRQSLMR